MKKSVLLLNLLLILNSREAFLQQRSCEGMLLFKLGVDTTMIGSYKLDGEYFDLTVLARDFARVYKEKGAFFENGEIRSVEGYSYKTSLPQDTTFYEMFVLNDSSYTIIRSKNKIQTYVYKGRSVVNNMIGHPTFFFFPFWPHFSPPLGDSLVSQHFWWDQPKKYVLSRTGKRTLYAGSSVMGNLTLHLTEKGDLEYIDAIGSNLNVIGHILPQRSMDSVIDDFSRREKMNGAPGSFAKFDSVMTTIGSNHLKIRYSRPSIRGRTIFGEVVPYGRFWRTGANTATEFQTDLPVYFGEKILPAGTYSLFTLPEQDRWTLMVNKDVGMWGTEYAPDKDILRTPMVVEDLESPVEMMTIKIQANDRGGTLAILWERKKISVSFQTKDH